MCLSQNFSVMYNTLIHRKTEMLLAININSQNQARIQGLILCKHLEYFRLIGVYLSTENRVRNNSKLYDILSYKLPPHI